MIARRKVDDFRAALPAAGLEFVRHALGVAHENLWLASDEADLGQADSGNLFRNALAGAGGEEKFVVLAAVEG